MNDSNDVDRHAGAVHRRDVGRLIRLVVVAAIVVVLVLVAMDNRTDVRIGYVFDETQAPLWIAVAAATACGVVIGWLTAHRPNRR